MLPKLYPLVLEDSLKRRKEVEISYLRYANDITVFEQIKGKLITMISHTGGEHLYTYMTIQHSEESIQLLDQTTKKVDRLFESNHHNCEG